MAGQNSKWHFVLASLFGIILIAAERLLQPDDGCAFLDAGSCRSAAIAMGLNLGGGLPFEDQHGDVGCFYYPPDSTASEAGNAYFGTGGTKAQMEAPIIDYHSTGRKRLDCGAAFHVF